MQIDEPLGAILMDKSFIPARSKMLSPPFPAAGQYRIIGFLSRSLTISKTRS
ncbi:MAG: hypothetical protein JRI95_10690 [Deltaproteobacteria bacterium]|nr:hypothetical protein [Deltaproteobacteria bacterium]